MARKSFILDDEYDDLKVSTDSRVPRVIDMVPDQKEGKAVFRPSAGGALTGSAAGAPSVAGNMAGMKVPIIDGIIEVVNNIVTTIRDISVEKERTRQVQAQADAMITGYREQTKQTELMQKEETRRAEIHHQTRLAELAADIHQNKVQVEKDIAILRETNKWKSEQLRTVQVCVDACLEALKLLNEEFLRERDPSLRSLLHQRMQSYEAQMQHAVTQLTQSIKPI